MEHGAEYVTKRSPWAVADTVTRLTNLMSERGMTIFAIIDQRAAARGVGLELRETTLVVFGTPAVGAAIMTFEPLAGLDLPLKVLVWDGDGQTWVSYVSPTVLTTRYSLPVYLVAPLTGIDQLVEAALAVNTSDPHNP